ncbi:LysR family transcriptional regulator [Glaciimonas sp. GG7]
MEPNLYITKLVEMATFVLVVEKGSFSAAAAQLGITPSAVSRQITRLERTLSTRLLERSTRKLRLSEAGVEAFKRCREMVLAARSVMDIGEASCDEAQGLIRMSLPKAFGRFVIHPHIPKFLHRYPKVNIQLMLSNRHIDLIDDQMDLMIRITDQPPLGLAGRPLMQVKHVIVASSQYLKTMGTPLHPLELSEHNCLYLGENTHDRRWKFQRGAESVTITIKGRYAANDADVQLDSVRQNLGIASLPLFTARDAIKEGTIVTVLPEWDFNTSYCGTAWILYAPTRYLAAKSRAFIDYISDCLKTESALKN